jgi:hypothetical protein
MALAAHHLGQPPAHDRELEDIGHGQHARIVPLACLI